jgi:hypothetical protein
MRPELILKSFEATGVWLMDTEVILKRFNTTTSVQDEDTELRDLGDGDTSSDIRKIQTLRSRIRQKLSLNSSPRHYTRCRYKTSSSTTKTRA